MAEGYEPVNTSPRDEREPARSKKDAAFRSHLLIYVVTGIFLVTLNVLTSFGEWWFYWPLFFWGWAVVLQAVMTYGTDAPARVLDTLRSFVPGSTATAS